MNKKTKKSIDRGLNSIVCIGETLKEREAGKTFSVLEIQISEGLKGLTPALMGTVVIAYEPVWAIGTGKTATAAQAEEVHQFIRNKLKEQFNTDVAEKTRILYGGSVKPDNIDQLMAEKDIDGVLVGGASLKVDSFSRIVKFT